MGEVIQFTKPSAGLYALFRRYGELAGGIATHAATLELVQAQLLSAEAHGARALAKLGECHELLDWTLDFCGECLAATEGTDVTEMVRQRDELVRRLSLQRSNPMPRYRATCR